MAKINKKYIEFLLIGIFMIALSSFAVAMGYSSAYTAGSPTPLTIAPGETKTIEVFMLTASPQEGTIVYSVALTDDGGIASLVDSGKEYSVNSNSYGSVKVRLTAPADAVEGHAYTLKFQTRDITPRTGSGMIGIRGGSTITIPVYIKPLPPVPVQEETGNNFRLFALLVILIIAILIVALLLIKAKGTKSIGKKEAKQLKR